MTELSVNRSCWVLLVTRGMQIHLPPEMYTNLDQAEDEARRWLTILFGWRPTTRRAVSTGVVRVGREYSMHLIHFELPDPWRAGSMWLGTEWGERSFPRMRSTLLPGDFRRAYSWASGKLVFRGGNCRTSPWLVAGRYKRGGRSRYIAASRIKRIDGGWFGGLIA
jgi:hypothetical protein